LVVDWTALQIVGYGGNFEIYSFMEMSSWCSDGRRTRDRKVASSTPGRGAIKSTIVDSTFHPSGYVNRVPLYQPAWLGLGGARSLVSGGR